MRLDDEAARVAIGLRLGLELCVPHRRACVGLTANALTVSL